MMLYIIHYDIEYHNFILEPLKKRDDVCLIPLPVKISNLGKLIVKLEHLLHLNLYPKIRYRYTKISEIKNICSGDKILLFSILYPKDVRWIQKKINNYPINIWSWNPISEYQSKYINLFKLNNAQIYTFDKHDANKYNIGLLPQVYRSITSNNCSINYDFYFIGNNKGRIEDLDDLALSLEQLNLNGRIEILGNPNIYNIKSKSLYYLQSFISYNELLRRERESRILIDIVQSGQTGLTLRVLEALYMEKKIISNNHTLKTYPWYRKNNVYIIGENNEVALKEFVNANYEPVPEELLSKHNIEFWIDNF